MVWRTVSPPHRKGEAKIINNTISHIVLLLKLRSIHKDDLTSRNPPSEASLKHSLVIRIYARWAVLGTGSQDPEGLIWPV